MSAKELIDRGYEDNLLTISFQWDEKYIEKGNSDFGFTLEPKITLYYINDEGERIENGTLNDDKYYVVIYGKEWLEDGEYKHTKRIVLPGLYRYKYQILKNDPNGADRIGSIILLNYSVGNINQ